MDIVLDFAKQMCLYGMIAIFMENSVLARALGASTSLWMIRKKYNIFLFGLVFTMITTVSSLIAYYIRPLLENDQNNYYITPLIFVCIIGLVYVIMLVITNRLTFRNKDMVLVFIHRCSFNCAVLGALLLSFQAKLDLAGSLGFGIGTGIGFTLATFFIYIAYEYLNSPKIPKAFRGFPITLLYIGILSLGLYGLIGHELPI